MEYPTSLQGLAGLSELWCNVFVWIDRGPAVLFFNTLGGRYAYAHVMWASG